MSESNHTHHGPNSLVWGARPCNEQDHKYKLSPDLISYEELLCQLDKHLRDIDSRFENQSSSEPDLSFEEQWTGRWDRTDPDGPKKIYVKTVDFGMLPNNSNKYVPHNINGLRKAIDMKGFGHLLGTSTYYTFPNADPESKYNIWLHISPGDQINIKTGIDRSNVQAWVTIYYTKNE